MTCLLSLLLIGLLDDANKNYQLDPTSLPIPYQRYTTKDNLGRTITFYLSRVSDKNKDANLPVVLVIGGSGSQSIFMKSGDRIGGGMQNLVTMDLKDKARIVCVEKPGVKFLDFPKRPGSAEEGSEEFRREHTLERWGEANCAALRAVWSMPGIDTTRTLVMGHSEGALTSSYVAAQLPQVTHVAPLAGAGPTQLHSLIELAADPKPGDQPGDADKRRASVYAEWQKVMKDPDSITTLWMGHPHRRWTSFLKHNSTDLLLKSNAKIYLAHGTADTSSHISELDVLRAELAAHGRDVVAERLEGLDHGYRKPGTPANQPGEMQNLFQRIGKWFLEPTASAK